MSPTEGLERLKNWQKSENVLLLPSVSLKGSIRFFEVRVKVAFVDESTLVLLNVDSPAGTETLDLRGAGFSCTETTDLEVTVATGTKTYLREET